MKIHLLSDIHLESGPFELPPDLECDVIVAAGDVGVGTQGVEWLKTLNKPVVYVAGNHEYWSKRGNKIDMFQVQRDIRKAAESSNVHYLENDKVIIDGFEFIGATLWTNLGSCGYELAPGFIHEARWMGDSAICCKEFYQDDELYATFIDLLDRYLDVFRERNSLKVSMRDEAIKGTKKGEWHPLVSLVLHNRSLRFIKESTQYDVNKPAQKRIVVTHHHPSYRSLTRLKSIDRDELHPRLRVNFVSGREPSKYLQAATYASDLEILQPGFIRSRDINQFSNQISHWFCGHLHNHLDYYQTGVRICCNPRGRYRGPMTKEARFASALFGYPISDERTEEINKEFEVNPFGGDAYDFNRKFVIDVDESIAPVFNREIDEILPDLNEILQRIKCVAVHLETTNLELFVIVMEKLESIVDEFDEVMENFSREISQCEVVFKGPIDFSTSGYIRHFELKNLNEEIATKIRMKYVPRAIEIREFMIGRIEEFKGLSFRELNNKLAHEATIKDLIPIHFYEAIDDDLDF